MSSTRTENPRTTQARQAARDSGRHPAGRNLATRSAVATLVAAGMLAGTVGTAQATPGGGRAAAELQREAADQAYQPPAWMLDPKNHRNDARKPVRQEAYDAKDIILGVTLIAGLVVLW